MNDGGRKIWIGCGLGCALLAVLAVGSCVGGLSWLRGITAPLETAVETRRELEEAQGAPSDYRPPADGRIPADRWETFLAIREATDGERRRLGEALDALDLSEEELRELEEKGSWTAFGRALGLIRHSLSLAPRMGAFYEARNAAMLERGMGMGEYTWLHVLAFRSGPPPEAPAGAEGETDDAGLGIGGDALGRPARGRVHRHLVAILEHLEREAREPEWKAEVAAELAELRGDRSRRLWPDGLPERLEEELAPRRGRIRATEIPGIEGLELTLQRKTGSMSYTIE